MSENNSIFTLKKSSELNYQLIIQTTENQMNTKVHYSNQNQPMHLEKVDFKYLKASFPNAAHGVEASIHLPNLNSININTSNTSTVSMSAASFPLEASSVKPHHMEGDIFFLFGLFCMFSVFMSMYYVFFAEQKN